MRFERQKKVEKQRQDQMLDTIVEQIRKSLYQKIEVVHVVIQSCLKVQKT